MESSVPSDSEALEYMESLKDWGVWGDEDALGTLNLITPVKRMEAAGLVSDGITVSCARPVTTDIDADTTYQVVRHMVDSGEGRDLDPPERALTRRGAAGVTVEPGDAVLVRTGNYRRRLELGPWDPESDGMTACHVACAPWFHQRQIAMLGTDTPNDVRPNPYQSFSSPFHTVALVAMGLWLIYNCDLEGLAEAAQCHRVACQPSGHFLSRRLLGQSAFLTDRGPLTTIEPV